MTNAFTLGVLSSSTHITWTIAAGSKLEDRPVYVKTTCFETFPCPAEDSGLTRELLNQIAELAEQIDAHRHCALDARGSKANQQAAHPSLTLTGMYNVLEALKAGRDLTAKEKNHTRGLVGVLKELHDELDAAVLKAYGLKAGLNQSENKDALLSHLVSLNAQRAAEETAGKIRWLRTKFQNTALRVSATAQLLTSASTALRPPEIYKPASKAGTAGKKAYPESWKHSKPWAAPSVRMRTGGLCKWFNKTGLANAGLRSVSGA